MKEKDLRRLSRADLLEMLIDESKEVQILREKLEKAEAELKKKRNCHSECRFDCRSFFDAQRCI